MKKGRKIVAAAAVLLLVMGMPVYAADNSGTGRTLDPYASLRVGDTVIISDGELTGDMPENVSYDLQTNVLTLDGCDLEINDENGIFASFMGDDFTIQLIGSNSISGTLDYGAIIARYGDTTLKGPGSLTMEIAPSQRERDPKNGIMIGADDTFTIAGADLNITSSTTGSGYFYGITREASYREVDGEIIIKDSALNITSTLPAKSEAANSGIDAQQGDLQIINSDVDIALTNGNIFGIGVGLKYGDIYGGRLTVDGSEVTCATDTDMGEDYNHNMYFYEMPNQDQLHFYAGKDGVYTEKSFEDTFELDKYMRGRYDTNYNYTVISSKVLPEYCDHQWNDGVVTKDPTCEDKGEMSYTCTVCGETKTEEIAALGHDWNEWNEIKAATCTEEGAKIRTCSRCNETETQPIAALGHDFVTEVVKEPTCTKTGLQQKTCSRCDLVIEDEVIPALGHDYEWTVEKEPTFHEDGVKKGTCANCGNVITKPIPNLSETHEHDFSGKEEIIESATCTKEGSKKVYCTEPECGEYIVESIPMTDHTPGEWNVVKEATCSENGLEEKTCTVCGAVVETHVTDKLEHTYSEWSVTKEVTCTEAGVETVVCTVCGETTVRGINPLGHDFAEWNVTKEATCTENGEETSTCTRCGEISVRVIEAAGHAFGDWKIVKEATLTEEGERQAVCSVCGEVKSEIIPKLSELQPVVPGNGDSGTGTDNNGSAEADAGDDNIQTPQTGDSTPIVLCVFVMAAAAGVAFVAVRKRV